MSGARGVDEVDLGKYLAECRAMVIDEIREMVPKESRASRVLYDLMLDYPLRALEKPSDHAPIWASFR